MSIWCSIQTRIPWQKILPTFTFQDNGKRDFNVYVNHLHQNLLINFRWRPGKWNKVLNSPTPVLEVPLSNTLFTVISSGSVWWCVLRQYFLENQSELKIGHDFLYRLEQTREALWKAEIIAFFQWRNKKIFVFLLVKYHD